MQNFEDAYCKFLLESLSKLHYRKISRIGSNLTEKR
jgi:hypothetical protein